MITSELVQQYLHQLIPERNQLLARLEREAAADAVPIIQLESAQLLRLLMLAHRPKRICEIGTAIGYSTIWLAEAAPEASVVTIERNEEWAARARANLIEAGVAERVEIIVADATAGLDRDEQFDCLFIDAAKGQYLHFLQLYMPLVRTGGMIISDNVLFRGLVADPDSSSKRQRPMVEKLQNFNEYIANHPDLDTSVVPIGDGLAISIKR